MLKKIRITTAVIIFCLITFYFLDFAGILSYKIHVLGHIQFIPALLSHSIGIIILLIVCALLFGRVYCSIICPMGIFQDIVNWFSQRINSKKKFDYRKNNPILRWSIVAITLILFFAGFTVLTGILDPYSAYGRMAVHLFKPVYQFENNILASIFNTFGNYTFYQTKIEMLCVFSFIVAMLTFLIIGVLAWANGRLYCNTVCPVGTIQGFLNKFSLFKIRMNDKCTSCGICAKKCKASCIDVKNKTVEYSCCVNCFNCINSCPRKGISFTAGKNKPENQSLRDENKRRFLLAGLTTAIAIPTVWAQAKTKPFFGTQKHFRKTPITPPGSTGAERLLKHCTSCHLCVSKCPSKVLKPAFMEYGIGGMMQPVMHFEKGFCNYNCTLCSNICPNKALIPLTVEQKHQLQVGKVVFNPEHCGVYTKGWNCGACSEHCPTQAVKMIPYKNGLTVPSINMDICVGCGGCEFICPVRPRAIYVEGNAVHQPAKAFEIE